MNHFKLFCLILVLIFGCRTKKNQKEVVKINNSEKTSSIEKSLIDQGLVNIQSVDSTIKVELKYSTTDNFFHKDVYGNLTNAYCQYKVAEALKDANQALSKLNQNYHLIIYDAVRPANIQKILWNALDSIPPKKRKDFVADPSEGSIHNYGCAIDLSIFNTKTNQALDMGTKYDYFGHLAYPRLETEMLKVGKLNIAQIQNRKLLRKVMIQSGFEPITSEWWHFNYYTRNQAKKLFKIIH